MILYTYQKFHNVIHKNEGYVHLKQINQDLSGEIVNDNNLEFSTYTHNIQLENFEQLLLRLVILFLHI
jgi:hypothetical protein